VVVELKKEVRKVLRKAPKHIVSKLKAWIDLVENEGIEIAREIPGFNDEALRGKLSGKRSIRLSKQWRAVYSIQKNEIEFLLVEKVSPHEYKK
jgi:toxin HigB-1